MIGWALRIAGLALILWPALFRPLLAPLAPANAPVIYGQDGLLRLAASHLALVLVAVSVASVIAVAMAVAVTRPWGADFRPLSRVLVSAGQTFPPVAVLALAVPAMGFGPAPVAVALFLYALLPVFENALGALENPPPRVIDAAFATGMTARQRLWQVELPLALPVILTGMRLSAVISLGTATLGAAVAAPTLGQVIIAGLVTNNTAFVVQGALAVAALALWLGDAFGWVQARVTR